MKEARHTPLGQSLWYRSFSCLSECWLPGRSYWILHVPVQWDYSNGVPCSINCAAAMIADVSRPSGWVSSCWSACIHSSWALGWMFPVEQHVELGDRQFTGSLDRSEIDKFMVVSPGQTSRDLSKSMDDEVLPEHTIFCLSWNSFGYFTWKICLIGVTWTRLSKKKVMSNFCAPVRI